MLANGKSSDEQSFESGGEKTHLETRANFDMDHSSKEGTFLRQQITWGSL